MSADFERAASAAVTLLLAKRSVPNVKSLIYADDAVRLVSYKQVAAKLRVSRDRFAEEYAESRYAYTKLSSNGIYYILYNDALIDNELRSHLAHEYAHTLLGHTVGGANDSEETEADCCSRVLLCPAPAADELDLVTKTDYIRAFRVGSEMASQAVRCRAFDRDLIGDAAPKLLDAMRPSLPYMRKTPVRMIKLDVVCV